MPTPPGALTRLRGLAGGRAREVVGDIDPGRPGLRVLLVVALAAALLGAFYMWRSRPEVDLIAPAGRADGSAAVASGSGPPGPPGARATGTDPGVASAGSGPASGPGAASTGAGPGPVPAPARPVVVHVVGRVRRPGVVTLPAGARVVDAVTAAGGPRPGARTDQLNLARHVVDGEQIVVGRPAGSVPGSAAPPLPGPVPGPAPGASGQLAGAAPGVVDLNTATAEQLEQLPGVGEVLAQRILSYRVDNGGFRAVEQLREIVGIGERTFAEIKDRVRV